MTKPRAYSNAEMLGYLVAWHREHGSSPTIHAWTDGRPAGAPHVKTYRLRFGSWSAAAKAAGIQPNESLFRPQGDPDEPLVESVQALIEEQDLAESPPAATAARGSFTVSTSDIVIPPEKAAVIRAATLASFERAEAEAAANPTPDEIVTARWMMHPSGQTSIYVHPKPLPDWREDLRRRYVTTLIEYIEGTTPWEDESVDVFYADLLNRIERLLGLRGEAS